MAEEEEIQQKFYGNGIKLDLIELSVSEWISRSEQDISWIKLFIITNASSKVWHICNNAVVQFLGYFLQLNWEKLRQKRCVQNCYSKRKLLCKQNVSKIEQKHFPSVFVLMSIVVWSDNVTADDGKRPNTRHLISRFQFLL